MRDEVCPVEDLSKLLRGSEYDAVIIRSLGERTAIAVLPSWVDKSWLHRELSDVPSLAVAMFAPTSSYTALTLMLYSTPYPQEWDGILTVLCDTCGTVGRGRDQSFKQGRLFSLEWRERLDWGAVLTIVC